MPHYPQKSSGLRLSALFSPHWGLEQLSLLPGLGSVSSRMSPDLSGEEGEASRSSALAAGSPAAFGSSPGRQPAHPPHVMEEGKTSCTFSPGQDGDSCSGGVKLGARGSGKETRSLSPAVRGLKSGWGFPALGIPSLQAVRSLVRAPAHLRGSYCRHVRMLCGLKLWPSWKLPLGRQPGLPRAQLAEGQTAVRDRPLPGGWLLSHVGLQQARGQTGNNPGEIQKHRLGYIKGP